MPELTFLPPKDYHSRFYDSVVELRVIDDSKKDSRYNISYAMTPPDWQGAYEAIRIQNRTLNIYACLNPLKAESATEETKGHKFIKLSSHNNKIKCAVDSDIAYYRWLYIDLDPKRATKTAATDAEKEVAYELSHTVKAFMSEQGFHDPVFVDSGNGYHMYYRIQLPNDEDSRSLIQRVLKALDAKFSTEKVAVDKSVFNAARLTKLQGTMSRKGTENISEGRIHRLSGFIEFPDDAENLVNEKHLLEAIALPKEESSKKEFLGDRDQKQSIEDVDAFFDKYEIAHWNETSHGCYKYYFQDGCPFDSTHDRKDAYVMVSPEGKKVFKCLHDSCSDYGWHEFVKHFDPSHLTPEEWEEKERIRELAVAALFEEYGGEISEEDGQLSETVENSKEENLSEKDSEKMVFITDKKGVKTQDIPNFLEVLRKDPKLCNLIGYNELEQMPYNLKKNQAWTDSDDARVLAHLEGKYKLSKRDGFTKALHIRLDETRYNPVVKKIESIAWDGKPRIHTALIDYLGCEDSEYTREVSELLFLGSVKRAYEAGCKYDYMVVLIGTQGCGKSTFCRRMALEDTFFTDSLRSVGDKDSSESLLGSWIIEWGEMAVMKRARDAETLKLFISQNVDKFRPAYGRYVQVYPRRCVFIGTTNDDEFLTDITGNRRFIPIRVSVNPPTKSLHTKECLEDFQQMMAEALQLYKQGRQPYLSDKVQKALETHRESAVVDDPRVGMIRNWLENNPDITRVCTRMIHDKVFDSSKELTRSASQELGKLLTFRCNMIRKEAHRFPVYGNQKHWVRDETWDTVAPTRAESDALLADVDFDDI